MVNTRFAMCSVDAELPLNIKNSHDTPLPPLISAKYFNERGGFDGEAAITRNADGSVASRFKDNSWDFSGLVGVTSMSVTTMYFTGDEEFDREVKTLIKLAIITPAILSLSIDKCFLFYSLIKRIAFFCKAEKITVKKLFNTSGGIRLVNLIKNEAPFFAQTLIHLSVYLSFIGEKIGFEHGYKSLRGSALSQLRKVMLAYKRQSKQTPVIPAGILKQIYCDTILEYESFQPVLDELLEMQYEIDLHPMIGMSLEYQKDSSRKLCGTKFTSLKETYPTNIDLGRKYPLARNYLNRNFSSETTRTRGGSDDFDVLYDRRGPSAAINYVQRVCLDMMVMFTGMRPAEARLLPYFGSKETVVDGIKYWLIYGFALKKRSSKPPFEMWVTNEYGYLAFQTAKRIADLYYHRNQRIPTKFVPDSEVTPELSPLFLRADGKIAGPGFLALGTPARNMSYLITPADADELKMIDPHRKWDEDPKFAVGKSFPVELRQFRRSVAFFASASGVRLVDLKNQLHHLFESQTFYYASGSGRASPFLKNKDSFASYFNQVKHEAEAFSFINEVINFDGKLFGASVEYAERNNGYYTTIRSEERTETIKRFEKGELAYRQTHVGACKTVAPCKHRALGSVIACLSCPDAVIKPAKLANAIKDQAQLVDSSSPDRLEFRTEIEVLFDMLDFAIKNIGNAMENLDRRNDEYKQFSKWRKEFKQMKKSYTEKLNKNRSAV